MSKTKWLPVATTARPTTGAHGHAMRRALRELAAAASAALTANAKAACRLGTAASGL
jgi:hypothetical protein